MNQQLQQQTRYQNVSLPEPIYDQVYAGHQPNPLSFRDVKGYVNHIKEQIDQFSEEYKVLDITGEIHVPKYLKKFDHILSNYQI